MSMGITTHDAPRESNPLSIGFRSPPTRPSAPRSAGLPRSAVSPVIHERPSQASGQRRRVSIPARTCKFGRGGKRGRTSGRDSPAKDPQTAETPPVSSSDARCGRGEAPLGLPVALLSDETAGLARRRRLPSRRPSACVASAQARPGRAWPRREAARGLRAAVASRLRRNSMRIACYRSTSSFPSKLCFSCAPADAPPSRSNRHAPPESASQLTNQTTGFVETNSAKGAATQMLMQLKQSMRLPINPSPSQRRVRKTISAGPSSFASRWVTRQVARTARRKRNTNSSVGTSGTKIVNGRRCRR